MKNWLRCGRYRQRGRGVDVLGRIGGDEAWQLCIEQHQKRDPLGTPRAGVSHHQSVDVDYGLIHCGCRAHQIETSRRNVPQPEPGVPRYKTLEILKSRDVQIVLVDDVL